MIVLDVAALAGLSTEEIGAAVHEELRRTGHTIAHGRKGPDIRPRVKRDHPLYSYLYDLGVYLALKCARCSITSSVGLSRSYWGEWLCRGCITDLARPGGELDQRGWPEPTRAA